MSFQNVKPTKPELDRLKKKKNFSVRGENLLEIKREQLINALKSLIDKYFLLRNEIRTQILEDIKILEKTYEISGKRKVERISRLAAATNIPSVDIIYIHELGLDIPKIQLNLKEKSLPTYSFSDTSISLDILMKQLKKVTTKLALLAELDSKLYRMADDNKKIQRRIDALGDIVIPQLTGQINAIEEILNDEEREEFIRMKKIKEFLENEEKVKHIEAV